MARVLLFLSPAGHTAHSGSSARNKEGTMARLGTTLMAIIGAGGLLLASTTMAAPEDTTSGSPATAQTRAQQGRQQTDAGPAGRQQQAGRARTLGPGDGTGNAGVKPNDGTGFGSPGRFAGTGGKAVQAGSSTKSRKQASKAGASTGGRSRARTFAGSGSRGTCTGAGARRGGSGSRRGGSGSRR
jgi:hypothetical protein